MDSAFLLNGSPPLAITREIVDSRILAIPLIGSLRPPKLIVSTLSTKLALNLKQKAEKTLIGVSPAVQLFRPTKDFGCRESFLVNLGFCIVALHLAREFS
jgi:hypothetical protein